jgi:hypothetical protein
LADAFKLEQRPAFAAGPLAKRRILTASFCIAMSERRISGRDSRNNVTLRGESIIPVCIGLARDWRQTWGCFFAVGLIQVKAEAREKKKNAKGVEHNFHGSILFKSVRKKQ